MAITQASLTSGSSTTTAASYTTASIAPTANRLQIVKVLLKYNTASQAGAPASVTRGAFNYTQIANRNDTAAGINLSVWRGLEASPASGAVTVNSAGAVNCIRGAWSISEFDGIDTGGTNGSAAIVQSATNADNSGTVATVTATLAAFGSASNGAVSAHGWFHTTTNAPAATPDTGWTEIHDIQVDAASNDVSLETQWRADNDTTALATWASNGAVYAVAVELKAAAAGGSATLTAESVSYALTLQAVGLAAGRKLAAGSISYSLTLQDVTLATQNALVAESISYNIILSDATADYAVTAAAVEYTLALQDIATRHANVLAAAPLSFSFALQNVAFISSGATTIGVGLRIGIRI